MPKADVQTTIMLAFLSQLASIERRSSGPQSRMIPAVVNPIWLSHWAGALAVPSATHVDQPSLSWADKLQHLLPTSSRRPNHLNFQMQILPVGIAGKQLAVLVVRLAE